MSSSFLSSLPAAIHIGQSVLAVAGLKAFNLTQWKFSPTRLAKDLIPVGRLPRRHWSCEAGISSGNQAQPRWAFLITDPTDAHCCRLQPAPGFQIICECG